jgi:phage tail protein X
MAKQKYYNRYQRFVSNGIYKIIPLIDIPKYDTDLYLTYDKSTMRMDNLSYKYYASPDYAWLIMLANPSLGSLEYLIPDGATVRIPYPLGTALSRYEKKVTDYLSARP